MLVTQQHGIWIQKSTFTNLISCKHFLLDSFSKGEQTVIMYTNFDKAFDRFDHSLLVMKLRKIGYNNPLLSWFNSFLTQRTLTVIFKNYNSKPLNVISDVL